MSSYLVSSTTALAAASAINDDPKCEDEKTLKIAGYLLYLNAEATASRYSEKPQYALLDASQAREFTPEEQYGCLQCWMYQVNVSDYYEKHELYYCAKQAAEDITDGKSEAKEWYYLPHMHEWYRTADDSLIEFPWGIDDEQPNQTALSFEPAPSKPSKFATKKRIPTKLRAIQSQMKAMQA